MSFHPAAGGNGGSGSKFSDVVVGASNGGSGIDRPALQNSDVQTFYR